MKTLTTKMILALCIALSLVAGMEREMAAQAVANATVTGRVVDTQNAVVPGAHVMMIAVDTGTQHQTTTNDDGQFTIPNLAVGGYTLTVTSQGFQTYEQKGIVLRVNDNIQLNVGLTVGSVTDRVEVQADVAMVQVQQNNVGQVIDQRRIVELPLNGRDATQLITISGGAVNHTDGTNTGNKSFLTSQSISVAGGGGNQTNYLLDGGDNNDSFTNVNLPFPFPDALQEFSVETNSLPARNGLHPGGLVNVITKSGSNQWHGSAFEFLRNYKANAINYFSTRQDSLKRNQFGGTLGGKILTDRLFFFGGYQGSRIRQDPTASSAFVPTAAMLNGDFSAADGGGCRAARALYNPITHEALTTKKINTSYYDPAAVKLAGYLPQTSDPCGQVQFGTPVQSNETQYISRVDWTINSKHLFFGRYFYDDYKLAAYFNPKNILVTGTPGNAQRVQSYTMGDTYNFTPSLVNSLHFTFSRRRIDRGPADQGVNASALGVQNVYQGTNNYLQIAVANGGFNIGSGSGALGVFNVNSFQEADDVDWLKGKHQMAFGVDVIRTQDNVNSHYEDNGTFSFSNQFSSTTPAGKVDSTAGDSMLDFLTGQMNKYEQTMPQQIAYRQTVLGVYAQDTFHLTPKLVMNIGLRWEPLLYQQDYFARGSTFSRAAFDAGQKSQVFVNAPAGSLFYGDPGVPRAFTKDSYADFSPRLGFVYNPDGNGRTTFRIGGAYMYDTLATYLTYRVSANNLPYGITVSNQGGPYQFNNPWAKIPGGNPFPLPFTPPKNFTFPLAASQVLLPDHIKPVQMAQWTAGMQHQFGANWIFSLSYLGNRSTHMMLGNEINPALPVTVNGVAPSTANTQSRRVLTLANPAQGAYYAKQVLAYDGGFGDYHGMLASLEHRFANNFTVLANYTWSKCMFIGPVNSIGVDGTIQNPYNPRGDYGLCTYDATNIINVTGVVTSNFMHGGGWGAKFANGWQIAPIFRYQTGLPFNPTSGNDYSLSGVGQDRPNVIAGANPYSGAQRNAKNYLFLNPASTIYTPNAPGTFGNAQHNSLRGPGYVDMDAALSRAFHIYERVNLNLRFEAFNVLNHPNFNAPSGSISSSTFGKVTSALDPRILQIAGKITF